MKKTTKKKLLFLLVLVALVALAGCQRNVDANGIVLPEKVIYLTTPWKNAMSESFLSAILVWPLAQVVNFIGGKLGSAFWGVALTTILFNVLILGLSVKSTVSAQKMQMLQPQLTRIQAKYEGRTDDNSRMQQAQEMQALYNKHGVNPLGSLITPFLQMPILISMYYAVQRADVVVNGSFGGVSLSTTPSQAFKALSEKWPIAAIFLVMIICQYLSSKIPTWLAEKKRKEAKGYKKYADNKPADTQTKLMMIMMVGMIALIGFRWPAAMSLYWAVSSIVNVIKTVYIQWRYIDNAKV